MNYSQCLITIRSIMNEDSSSVCLVLDDEYLCGGKLFVDRLMANEPERFLTYEHAQSQHDVATQSRMARFSGWSGDTCLFLMRGMGVDRDVYETLQATAAGIDEEGQVYWKPANVWVFVNSIMQLPDEASTSWRIFRVCADVSRRNLFLFEL
jgi:hypothetical protein